MANSLDNTVSVIDTATNNVTATVNVGDFPFAFGQFIGGQPVLPVANFSANVTEGYAPLFVQFTDLSRNVTERCWNFGDGTNSTEHNPTHTYSTAGNYTVTLTASNSNGSDTKMTEVNVQSASRNIPGGFNFLILVMIILYLVKKSTRK